MCIKIILQQLRHFSQLHVSRSLALAFVTVQSCMHPWLSRVHSKVQLVIRFRQFWSQAVIWGAHSCFRQICWALQPSSPTIAISSPLAPNIGDQYILLVKQIHFHFHVIWPQIAKLTYLRRRIISLFIFLQISSIINISMHQSALEKSKSQLEMKLADMANFQKMKNYLAAQQALNDIKKLKQEIQNIQRQKKRGDQQKDMEDINAFQREELQAFQMRWAQKIKLLQDMKDQAIEGQQKIHQGELMQIEDQFQQEFKDTFHESKEYFEMEMKEKALAKLHKYLEAQEIKDYKKDLLEMEKKNYEVLLQQKLKLRLKQLKFKQSQERSALVRKHNIKIDEAEIAKNKELEELEKKQINTLRTCKSTHQKENSKNSGTLRDSDMSKQNSNSSRLSGTKSPPKNSALIGRAKSPLRNACNTSYTKTRSRNISSSPKNKEKHQPLPMSKIDDHENDEQLLA